MRIDAFVLGGRRCATSFIHKNLSETAAFHAPVKEPYFISKNMSNETLKRRFLRKAEGCLLDCSTGYSSDHLALRTIFRDYAQSPKLLVVRNPVDRILSYHSYLVSHGLAEPSLLEWLTKEGSDSLSLKQNAQLSVITDLIQEFPANRFGLVDFEKLVREPRSTLISIACFLNPHLTTFEPLYVEKLNETYGVKLKTVHRVQSQISSIIETMCPIEAVSFVKKFKLHRFLRRLNSCPKTFYLDTDIEAIKDFLEKQDLGSEVRFDETIKFVN